MSECISCGLPIHPSDAGVGGFGPHHRTKDICVSLLRTTLATLTAERDEAIRLRESDGNSLAFWLGELRRVADAMGLDGTATVTNMVDWARAGRWEIEARITMERERDEARAEVCGWLPCPFCGNPPRYTTYQDESLASHNIVDWHAVSCVGIEGCDIEMLDENVDALREAWNRRFTPPREGGKLP